EVRVAPGGDHGLRGTHVGVEIEFLAQRDVHGAVAAAHRGRERPLEGELGAADRIEGGVGKRRAGFVDGAHAAVLFVPVELHAHRVERFEGRRRDLGADAVTGDERGLAAPGNPGVTAFTARVSAVQGSGPSPRATVRPLTRPSRASTITTVSSAVPVPAGLPGVIDRLNTSCAGARAKRASAIATSARNSARNGSGTKSPTRAPRRIAVPI